MATDKEIFEQGQKDRFQENPYLSTSHNFETWEFGKQLPDKGFKSRKGSTITTDDNRTYRITYGKKGMVLMNEVRQTKWT
jgi:hypothetical protein